MEVVLGRTALSFAATGAFHEAQPPASPSERARCCGCPLKVYEQRQALNTPAARCWSQARRGYSKVASQKPRKVICSALEVSSEGAEGSPVEDQRDDSVLPDSLDDAVRQSAVAAAKAANSGTGRAIVELLIPELENLAEEGAQQRVYECAREFIQWFQMSAGVDSLRVIFPDAGAAALLRHRWAGCSFQISSLNDRKPVQDDDEAVICISPDHTALDSLQRLCSSMDDDEVPRPFVLWNERLISGDVGIGLNVRRLREGLLNTFTTAYSLRPTAAGSVFRCYPSPWQVFLDDPEVPGRYLLAATLDRRPGPDELDYIVMGKTAEGEGREAPTAGQQAAGIFASLSRFMKSLSS